MSAANLRMNNKRNQYHLICRVISICLCALFCLSFGCTSKQDELYIVVGYGKQLTGGYSIQFPDVYLTKENIVVTSVLLGPEGEEPANISYPYAVIKIEYRPEPVLFQ